MCDASIATEIKGMMEPAHPVFTRNELNDMLHYYALGSVHDDDDDDDDVM